MTIHRPPASAEEDVVLAGRFRAGDAEALGELYLRHFPSVYQTVGPRAGDPAATEDIAQAAFLRAWEQRERLADPGKFRPWLLSTARHLALDHRRERVRHGVETVSEHLPSKEPSADAAIAAAETPELVWKAVSSMEPRQREILHLTVREELSTAEVATVLGITTPHASVLVHRARRAFGAAVRTLLVATSARECAALQRLVPSGLETLSSRERATVDRHMRRCELCRAAADQLTVPSRLFGALPVLALPAGWDSTGPHAVMTQAGASGGHAVAAHGAVGTGGTGGGGVPATPSGHPLALAAAGLGAAGVIIATALLVTAHHQASAPVRAAPVHAAAVAPVDHASITGRIAVSGDDPDVHAHSGPNAAGARHLIQALVAWTTRAKTAPRLLLVTDVRDPGGALFGDPRLGLRDAGLSFAVADLGSGAPGVLDLRTVRFADYDAVIVASDFGGWLRQEELDILDARRGDLAAFVNAGGGLVAFSEGGAGGVPGAHPITSNGWFGFLPLTAGLAPVAEYEAGVSVTADGIALGLSAADEARNYLHATFTPPPGATVLVVDPAGRAIAFSMAIAGPKPAAPSP